ncbi:hypothetical protein BH11PSE10_BH11PSE10_00940 [soil metagenome]
MSLRQICSAILLTTLGVSALATPVTYTSNTNVNVVADTIGGKAASISKTLTQAGLFSDTYTLIGETGLALLDGILSTSGRGMQNIDFYSATLNGVAFDFIRSDKTVGTTVYLNFSEKAVFAEHGLNSPYTLVISGRAGTGFAEGAAINASYSGSINLNSVSDVPEPASFALVALGLLGAGVVSRRRNLQK